ncbi:aminodeoxychorismate lyase [Sphingomonas sp. LH128]|uniref:Endolytic murein transglycosylase n=1 Tax=Novosphingobium resinovorum TaxID=158500 RepID=A0A031K3V9_9SPHN|nr:MULTISPECIES: endolytic transglycosylase MltG [Sphingomonadaceae]AOR76588.1 aminodeoxychorismate lyase [Novosphingobium resinovorum]EJU09271.1 aminodeoxychorismate lyase [Sphingomonas sp. LH128]EZP83920.1 Aminodeoxychorismate lyase [Novosphingobium resinovorum]
MISRRGCGLAAVVAVLFVGSLWAFFGGWYGSGPLEEDKHFVVPTGASLGDVADRLEKQGVIASASGFKLRARVFGGGSGIKAGEFAIPAHASPSAVLAIISSDEIIRRFVTIPEGMPSVMVYDRLKAQTALTGDVSVPEEGSILPDTYNFENGEPREELVRRMQAAMSRTLKELWANRAKGLVVKTPEQAIVLASIVEKETGKPSERRMVAGLYSNRLRTGMLLQADPTIIYPITKGKRLGRRILQSEIQAVNGYNTYTMVGLPKGPITNPSRESIAAVLNPAKTDALYMVADGTGGHAFAGTLAEHNRNVAKWFAIRRERGEL